MAKNPFTEYWQAAVLPAGKNPFLESFTPRILPAGSNPFLKQTDPKTGIEPSATAAAPPLTEAITSIQIEPPPTTTSVKIDLQKQGSSKPANTGTAARALTTNERDGEQPASVSQAAPAFNRPPFSYSRKWVIGGFALLVIGMVVWQFIKPDPLSDGKKAAQMACACQTTQNERLIKEGKTFLATFDGQQFKTREAAEARLNLSAVRATFETCQKEAGAFYSEKKSKYIGNYQAGGKFDEGFSQQSGLCQANNDRELGRVNQEIEAKLARLVGPPAAPVSQESFRYVGQVGGEPVDMTLTESHKEIGCHGGGVTYTGSYFYSKRGNQWQISLEGFNCAGNFQLDEFFNGQKTGHFEGQEDEANKISGTWKSDSKQLSFELRPVSAEYVNPTPVAGPLLFSQKENMRVRATPDLNGEVVAGLSMGEQVSFSGEQTDYETTVQLANGACSGPWLKVTTGGGKTGWVHKCGLGEQKPAQSASQSNSATAAPGTLRAIIFDEDGYTPVRSGPTEGSDVVTRIGRNQEFTVLTTAGSWWRVELDGGQSGYMHCSRIWLRANFQGQWPVSSQRFLTKNDLEGLSSEQKRLMRNEVFARHGFIFQSDDLRQHFTQQGWYSPKYQNVEDQLSAIEKANVKFIKRYE